MMKVNPTAKKILDIAEIVIATIKSVIEEQKESKTKNKGSNNDKRKKS